MACGICPASPIHKVFVYLCTACIVMLGSNSRKLAIQTKIDSFYGTFSVHNIWSDRYNPQIIVSYNNKIPSFL